MSTQVVEEKHIIWSNYSLNFDDWRDELKSEYPEKTEDELMALMHDINSSYLDAERENLNITISQPIIVIADLGLWDGRHSGYKEIASGNIRECLYDNCDYLTWYVDKKGDFRCDAHHHDGTNHYLYRAYKGNLSEHACNALRQAIYKGTATNQLINRYTRRLGDDIAKVYGWDFPARAATPKVKESTR